METTLNKYPVLLIEAAKVLLITSASQGSTSISTKDAAASFALQLQQTGCYEEDVMMLLNGITDDDDFADQLDELPFSHPDLLLEVEPMVEDACKELGHDLISPAGYAEMYAALAALDAKYGGEENAETLRRDVCAYHSKK